MGKFNDPLNSGTGEMSNAQTVLDEESVLEEAFPEYADYARRVPRFFPRLHRI